jgi:hypothetical protein
MIPAPLAAIALVIAVAVGPLNGPDVTGSAPPLGMQDKEAAVQPLVRSATECIARQIVADPRFPAQRNSNDFGELIVESMPACAPAVRAMIEVWHRRGRGLLQRALSRRAADRRRQLGQGIVPLTGRSRTAESSACIVIATGTQRARLSDKRRPDAAGESRGIRIRATSCRRSQWTSTIVTDE